MWIYCGVFSNGENLSKRRDAKTDPGGLGLYPNFGWTWPNNMRILYNRASCDRHGKPYPGSKPLVWWDEQKKKWMGYDVPDVPVLTDGPETPNGRRAFHLNAEGVARLFAAVYDGPRPEARRRSTRCELRAQGRAAPGNVRAGGESGRNVLHPKTRQQPDAEISARASHQPIGKVDDYPYVLMTSTVAEHWCARLDDPEHPLAERARARNP